MKSSIVLQVLLMLILGSMMYGFEYLREEQGIVVEKIHIPSYKREINFYSIILDAPMTEIRVIPDKYLLTVGSYGKEECICVNRDLYMRLEKGDSFVRCPITNISVLSYLQYLFLDKKE